MKAIHQENNKYINQRGIAPILIVLIVVGVLAAGAGIWYWNAGYGSPAGEPGMRPEGARDNRPSRSVPASVPEPPSGKVSIYKGFWMPCGFLGGNCQSMANVKDQKSAGANIALISPTVKINAKGEAKFDVPADYVEERLAEQADEYYKNGIRIGLVVGPYYEEVFRERSGGEPQPIPANLVSKPGFLDAYNSIVSDLAKLAEKYHVEIFSPMNEPDLQLGESTASAWGQKILADVKKHYNGKILWKSAGGALDKYNTNFKGYDIIGFDPSPGGGSFEQSIVIYKTALNNLLDTAWSRARRDGVSEVMITEFGAWGGAVKFTEDQKVLAHRAVFEAAKGRVSGFIALDPPTDLDRGLKGTKTLEEIKLWFTQKLGN